MVKALSTTQLFTDENSFGEFLKNQLISTKGLNLADIDNPESYSKTTEFIAEISEKKNWEYEIDILFDFIKEIQLIGAGDGPISNTSGSDGLDKVLNDPSKAEYRRLFTAKEENFVGINNSNILRMAIANAIKDAASVVGDFNGIDLKINSRINVQALVDLDNADERNAEINTVYSALEKIQSIKGSDFNDVRNDNEQLTNLKDALIFLHDSKIFNTLQNENLENEADATVFEGIVTEFLNATLGEEAVIGTTDKINNTELKYKTTLEIVRDSILNNRCNENLNDEWITKEASKGEIDNLFELIQSSSGVDFDNAGNDTGWLEEKADDLLPLLNKSKLLFRAIPHYIHMFTEQCDTSDFTTLDGTTRYELNLRAATPEYTYNADTKEYDHYDDEEISYLTTIMNNFTSLTDALRNKLDINFIKGENEEIIKETLNALANSSVFNQFNAKDLMDANSLETNDTVFIQLMWLIFDESSLSKVIYDAKTDGGLYDYMPGVTAHKNARNKIIEFNKQNSKSWEKEIDDIFNIFDSVTDETVTQIQDINVEKMSPDSITNILKTINSSDLCYDAVPVYIKKAFENVALSEFSKYNGENKENYLIGREDYNIELNNINKLLNEICEVDVDGQVNYNIKFGSEFEISSFGEKGLGTFIQFLLDSEIFKDCRGLVLKNAINSVGFADYIRNDYDAEHKNVFDKIFEKIETTYPSSEDRQKQIDIEGGALNSIASSLKEVIGNIPQDGENVFTSLNAKAVDGIFKGCFQNGKALIASEIVAGFLSTNIKDSGYLDDYYLDSLNDYSKLWFYSNGEDFAYPLFNELEANALSSSIDSINVITAVKNNYLNLNNPYEENGMPTEMTNAQKIVSCLESLYSKSTNEDSMIAKFIYKKGIYDKLIGENGICTMVHSNKDVVFLVFPNGEERKSSFETAYNDMLTERSSIVNNKNLFKNVHDDIMNMFNALAN